MKTDELINSGLLELYALGVASEEEQRQVEVALESSQEARMELDQIDATLEEVALEERVDVPPEVRENTMNKVYGKRESTGTTTRKISSGTRRNSHWWKIAATILLLISVATNVALLLQVDSLKDRMASLRENKNVMASKVDLQESRLNQMQGDLTALLKPGNRSIAMNGLGPRPNAQATVFWNAQNGKVYLSLDQLQSLPENQQYQLWALKDGKPKSAGVFNAAPDQYALQEMTDIKDADAFAVTIEPRGGSKTPTLEQLCLKGAVS